MSGKIPVRIIPARGVFRAAAPLPGLAGGAGNTRVELAFIEKDYRLMIECLGGVLGLISGEEPADPRLYWLAGDAVMGFLERLDSLGFRLEKRVRTIARDAGASETSIRRFIAFREKFSGISEVAPGIPWIRQRNGSGRG